MPQVRRREDYPAMGLKVLCLAKQTFATEAAIKLNAEGRIAPDGVKTILNPYDEFGLEEALQRKEQGAPIDTITLLTLGRAGCHEDVRKGLAFGADDAIVVDPGDVPDTELDGALRAAALAAAAKKKGFDLIFCGRVTVDSGAGEVHARMATILGIPLVNAVSKVELAADKATVKREADGRTDTLDMKLPGMLAADKSLNRPRYPTLPNIMKAKKKPLEVWALKDILPTRPALTRRVVSVALPPAKGDVKMVSGSPAEAADKLVALLRDEAKVLG